MLRLVLLCVVGVAVAQETTGTSSANTGTRSSAGGAQNTRFFGGLVQGITSGLNQLAGGNRPGGFFPGVGNVQIGQGGISLTGQCNYCRTQWGYVCCKQGTCPVPRPSCPPTRNFQPPQPCRGDGTCAGIDKCCFDTCLR